MPFLMDDLPAKKRDLFRRQRGEPGVKHVGIILVLLTAGIQDTVNIALSLLVLDRRAAGADAGKTAFVLRNKVLYRRQLFLIF